MPIQQRKFAIVTIKKKAGKIDGGYVTSTGWDQTAFSNDKGYPRSVTFHQNRLIFGGSRDKPQTIFGSQSGDFFNFDNFTRAVDGSGNVYVGGYTAQSSAGANDLITVKYNTSGIYIYL